MATEKKGERPPKDLSVPETMKIAALLAELMPTGAIGQPVPLATKNPEPLEDAAAQAFAAPTLQIDDLDEFETDDVSPRNVAMSVSPHASDLSSVPPLLPEVPPPRLTTALGVETAEAHPEKGMVERVGKEDRPIDTEATTLPALPPTPIPPPIDQSLPTPPSELAAGHFLAGLNWANDPSQPPISPPPSQPPTSLPERPAEHTETPTASRRAYDLELVPLGNLSAKGFFSLVNWTNDPQKVRHPRRADYGLDEQTLSQARKNPFYVVGQPRRPERDSVSEILAEIDWE